MASAGNRPAWLQEPQAVGGVYTQQEPATKREEEINLAVGGDGGMEGGEGVEGG